MSNCLFFAMRKWFKYGGFIIMRRSNYGWWPHFIWSKDLIAYSEYLPSKSNHHRTIPPLLFRGYVEISSSKQQLSKYNKEVK